MKIAIINQKGGSGKTTLAALLVKSLPDPLAVDLDPQGGLSAILAGEPEGPGVFDLIMGDDVQPRQVGNMQLLQSDERLDSIYATVQPFIIKSILRPFKNQYIVIDCPPTMQGVTRAAALWADVIITPADISRQALRSTLFTIKTLKEIKKKTRVYLIGKNPQDKSGYIPDLTRTFIESLGASFAGYIPKSVTVIKSSIKGGKQYQFIEDIIHGKYSN